MDTPEIWADQCKNNNNYKALASVFNSQNYDKTFGKFEKMKLAKGILIDAGSKAVPDILTELETEGVGSPDLADILVSIDDPSAIPLVKKLNDQGKFAAYSFTVSNVNDFIARHPEVKVVEESFTCCLCNTTKPVTEMKSYLLDGENKWFCAETCWMERGKIINQGREVNCEYYKDGMCCASSEKTLCSLSRSLDVDQCYVYNSKKTGFF